MVGERENDRTLARTNAVPHTTEDQKFFGSFASVIFSVIVSMSERRVTHTIGTQDVVSIHSEGRAPNYS